MTARLVLLGCMTGWGLAGQFYAAADDGRTVYFSGRPTTLAPVTRVWTWREGGGIRTALESGKGGQVSLEALSANGLWALVRVDDGWQVWRDGKAELTIAGARSVAMSRNGRWLAILRDSPRVRVERMELTRGGMRAAGVMERGTLRENGRTAIAADDGTVIADCGYETSCVWDGAEVSELPVVIEAGSSGRYLYYWNHANTASGPQALVRHDRMEGKGTVLSAECLKVSRTSYAPSGRVDSTWYEPQGKIIGTSGGGGRVLFRCGREGGVLDAATGVVTPVRPEAWLNSGLTQMLTRPEAGRFAWAPLSTEEQDLAAHDSIRLPGPLNASGVLTYSGEPDFTIEWGGQELPWLRGAHGYSYAPMPRDIVEGAVDAVRIRSAARPWLNVTAEIAVASPSATPLPLVAKDTGIVFIHGDYRGFVSAASPARRGDYLHFLLSGVRAADILQGGEFIASYTPSPRMGIRPPIGTALPIAWLGPTEYHPSIVQVTVRIPENAPSVPADSSGPTLRLRLPLQDGRTLDVRWSGYLRY